MATETDTQTASAVSKRAQLNRARREGSRVPEGQIGGSGANLAFDNGMGDNRKEGDNSRGSAFNQGSDARGMDDNGAMNFRQVMAQEKKRQKKKETKASKRSATYQGSKRALAMSWEALIPSWFTSIIIIDILAFLHVIFPKHFCSLGEEWESPMAALAGENKGSGAKSAMMKSVEPMVVILINLVILAGILIIIAIIALIAGAFSDPIGFVSALMGSLWKSIKSVFGG